MTPAQRLADTIRDNDAIRLAIAGRLLTDMSEDPDWFDIAEEACVLTFGPRVPCPRCWESCGTEVFRGMACYECGERVP